MKNILISIAILTVLSSCASTKETKSSRIELRKEKTLAKQTLVNKAVESRRYIIKLKRLYSPYGRFVDLRPRANYIIIDRDKAIISAAYFSRQFNFRHITGISMRGKALNYELTKNIAKGKYDIKLEINNGGNPFYVNIKISKNGLCSTSLINNRIDNIRYSGFIVPIREKEVNQPKYSKNI